MGFPIIPFRLCDFWAIHDESWSDNVLTVCGTLPGGDLAEATFRRQSGPMGSWQATTLTGKAVSNRQIYEVFKRYGVALSGRKPKPKQARPLVNYTGETTSEYARKIGVSKKTARLMMRGNGIVPGEPARVRQARERRRELVLLWRGEWPTEFARRHGLSIYAARRAIEEAKRLPGQTVKQKKKTQLRWGRVFPVE